MIASACFRLGNRGDFAPATTGVARARDGALPLGGSARSLAGGPPAIMTGPQPSSRIAGPGARANGAQEHALCIRAARRYPVLWEVSRSLLDRRSTKYESRFPPALRTAQRTTRFVSVLDAALRISALADALKITAMTVGTMRSIAVVMSPRLFHRRRVCRPCSKNPMGRRSCDQPSPPTDQREASP
jgi:hypothetical protein